MSNAYGRYFTLTRLSHSPECCFCTGLKSEKTRIDTYDNVQLEVCEWNIVGIHGKKNAKKTILNSTYFSKEKDCPFVDNAGANLWKKKWSGRGMESFGLNSARSFLGKNVNLHMKDGSVIVNVQVDTIQKDDLKKQKFVTCVPYGASGTLKVPLKTIAWAELLNLNLIRA